MLDSFSPFIKLVAARLKPLDPNEAMKCAVEAGTILVKELTPAEQEIIGNAFLVLGNILIKISQYHYDKSETEGQLERDIQIERLEIEIAIQKLQKRIDKLAERTSSKN